MIVKFGVINGKHTLNMALVRADRSYASGDVAHRWQGFVLQAHSQNQGVIGYDLVVIVQDDILVTAINVYHSGIDNPDPGLKHESLLFLCGVASRLSLEVMVALSTDMVVRETTRGNQHNVCELQVADGEQGLDKGDTCV